MRQQPEWVGENVIELRGSSYRLATSDSACFSCAFMDADADCIAPITDACMSVAGGYWKELSLPAFGCDNRASGGDKCESYCGDESKCVASGILTYENMERYG